MTKEWLDAANDDLEVIVRIVDDMHLTHVVGFHAQQAFEKSFKAVLEEKDLYLGKVHDLIRLKKRMSKCHGCPQDPLLER
jgi:HEPN domain-containing protein